MDSFLDWPNLKIKSGVICVLDIVVTINIVLLEGMSIDSKICVVILLFSISMASVRASPRDLYILFPKYGVCQLLDYYEEEKKVISKSFLYSILFFSRHFLLRPLDQVLYFVSAILNLFLYAFKPFHQIFLPYVFLTRNLSFLLLTRRFKGKKTSDVGSKSYDFNWWLHRLHTKLSCIGYVHYNNTLLHYKLKISPGPLLALFFHNSYNISC